MTIGSVHPCFLTSGCFLGIGSLDFSGFCESASNHYDVVHENSAKNSFLEFKEKFGH